MFRNIKVIVGIVVLLGVIWVGFWANNLWNGYPSGSPTSYSITVSKGDSLRSLAEKLEKDGVISSNQVLLIQSRFRTMETLQTGEYKLNLPANGDAILKQINEISSQKAAEIAKQGNRPKKVLIWMK
jgi:cell division protein YceG involved in septum cleavage